MQTDLLLLKRSLGSAFADQYVDWAVERLSDGLDSPSLRILAGLDPKTETGEVEGYFLKTCQELDVDCPRAADAPRQSLGLVRRSYERGDISAETAFYTLARLYKSSDYADPLLSVFYDIEEEISMRGSGYEGCFYPPEDLKDLEIALRREFDLFTQAALLDLPTGFMRFIRCERCGHIGESKSRHKTLKDKFRALIPWVRPRPASWNTCARCGSFEYKIMMDPEVRQDYYNRIRGEQLGSANK